jgi:hypothetical protein
VTIGLKMIQTTLRHSRLATTADVYARMLDELRRRAVRCDRASCRCDRAR